MYVVCVILWVVVLRPLMWCGVKLLSKAPYLSTVREGCTELKDYFFPTP